MNSSDHNDGRSGFLLDLRNCFNDDYAGIYENVTDCKYFSSTEISSYITACRDGFGIFSLNCRGLNAHYHELLQILGDFNIVHNDNFFKIVALTEIFKYGNLDSFIFEGYNFEFATRENGSRGGVALLVKNDISYTINKNLSEFIPNIFETLFIDVVVGIKKVTVGVVYRPPNSDFEEFKLNLQLLLNKLEHRKEVIITGDFNLDLLCYDTVLHCRDFADLMIASSFLPTITRPTRITDTSATLIDQIFVRSDKDECFPGILLCDLSDHFGTFCSLNYSSVKVCGPTFARRRILSEANMQQFKRLLQEWDFSAVLDIQDAETSYNVFLEDYRSMFEVAFPVRWEKVPRKYVKRNPWMTTGLIVSSGRKGKLLKKKLKTPNLANSENYKSYCQVFNKTLRAAKRHYYQERILAHQYDMAKTWATINDLMRRKQKVDRIGDEFRIGDRVIKNSTQIANEFNNYFTNIGAEISKIIPPVQESFKDYLGPTSDTSFYLTPVNSNEVETTCRGMRGKHSAGFDGISTNVMKATIEHISIPLTHIFNQSFQQGIFPSNLKMAKIVPIFKNGDRGLLNNYRPVSLLPAFSKILEKLVYKRLYGFLDTKKFFSEGQFGFRRGHSTIHPILKLLQDITIANDKRSRDATLAVFLDLSKAFDSIDHEILLYKLENAGIRGVPLGWLRSYLSQRQQYVQIKSRDKDRHDNRNTQEPTDESISEATSNKLTITCGVPQGSILGPLLFLVYVNDIQACTTFKILSYADDTTIYSSHHNLDYLETSTNQELNKLAIWLAANKLLLNPSKCKFMTFATKPILKEFAVTINSIPITRVRNSNDKEKAIKFLGVYFDECLTWSYHIDEISKKISQTLFSLNKIKLLLPKQYLILLYRSLVESLLLYGILAWGCSNKISKLTKIQKKAIRIVNCKKYLSHTDPLFGLNQVLKIGDLYRLGVCLFMHDFRNHRLPWSLGDMFIRHPHTIETRNRDLFLPPRPRTEFSNRLPSHNFINIYAAFENYINLEGRNKLKRSVKEKMFGAYERHPVCNFRLCPDCHQL